MLLLVVAVVVSGSSRKVNRCGAGSGLLCTDIVVASMGAAVCVEAGACTDSVVGVVAVCVAVLAGVMVGAVPVPAAMRMGVCAGRRRVGCAVRGMVRLVAVVVHDPCQPAGGREVARDTVTRCKGWTP